jgi:hypothetical protein
LVNDELELLDAATVPVDDVDTAAAINSGRFWSEELSNAGAGTAELVRAPTLRVEAMLPFESIG